MSGFLEPSDTTSTVLRLEDLLAERRRSRTQVREIVRRVTRLEEAAASPSVALVAELGRARTQSRWLTLMVGLLQITSVCLLVTAGLVQGTRTGTRVAESEPASGAMEHGARGSVEPVVGTPGAVQTPPESAPPIRPADAPDKDTTGAVTLLRDHVPEVQVGQRLEFDLQSESILFQTDSAELQAHSMGALDKIADLLIVHDELLRVRIEGHTDDRGDAAFNMALSQRRAQSVMAHLVQRGVHPDRLVATGFGEERPLTPDSTAEARQQNRRVEFVVDEL